MKVTTLQNLQLKLNCSSFYDVRKYLTSFLNHDGRERAQSQNCPSRLWRYLWHKCTKHQFIHLLTATCN